MRRRDFLRPSILETGQRPPTDSQSSKRTTEGTGAAVNTRGLGVFVHRQQILSDAHRLADKARGLGGSFMEEIAKIFLLEIEQNTPEGKKLGRPVGSRGEGQAKVRAAFGQKFDEIKTKNPELSDVKIAQQLRKGDPSASRKYLKRVKNEKMVEERTLLGVPPSSERKGGRPRKGTNK